MSDDDAGVGLKNRFTIQTPTAMGTWFRTLHPHVSLRNQSKEQVSALNGAWVQCDVKGIAAGLYSGVVNGDAVIAPYMLAD